MTVSVRWPTGVLTCRHNAKESGWKDADWDASVRKRYAFVSKCKRGGISHVNQPGRHDESVVGVDIVSQEPVEF